ncbi:hypothetical protein F5Y12DRAFT_796527 [Xylaria sp. FL1777]|nr:hypothetical protein F5Y12DRAFT_796527 [Xylaria sp. FL1777]
MPNPCFPPPNLRCDAAAGGVNRRHANMIDAYLLLDNRSETISWAMGSGVAALFLTETMLRFPVLLEEFKMRGRRGRMRESAATCDFFVNTGPRGGRLKLPPINISRHFIPGIISQRLGLVSLAYLHNCIVIITSDRYIHNTMRFLTFILIALLPLLGAATPVVHTTSVAPASPERKWTVQEVFRHSESDDTVCKWQMAIKESVASANSTANNSTETPLQCDFEVRVAEGHDCRVDNFGPARCSQSNEDFYVSAGHNKNRFIVMVVENVGQEARAFFGFADAALDAGDDIPPQTSDVREGNSDTTTTSLLAREQDDDGDADDEPRVWEILELKRTISRYNHIVDLRFEIAGTGDSGVAPVACIVTVLAPEEVVDLKKFQFYNKKSECGYYVSWGYDEPTDAAVMTLISPDRTKKAFFGFNDVNKSEVLKPSGIGIVLPCDCSE